MKYDLEKRTSEFGKQILLFLKTLKPDYIAKPLISQLVKSSTSVGANYREASEGSSKKDFRNKIAISKKESNESKHWLEMLSIVLPERKNEIKKLWQEAHELTLIFGTIFRNTQT